MYTLEVQKKIEWDFPEDYCSRKNVSNYNQQIQRKYHVFMVFDFQGILVGQFSSPNSKHTFFTRGHYITNPNNALLNGKSLTFAACLMLPEYGYSKWSLFTKARNSSFLKNVVREDFSSQFPHL